ncbi:hypothetical protein D9M71_224420 [compost metagenome]
MRGVVASIDGDQQLGRIGGAEHVSQAVGKHIEQGLTVDAQGLHGRQVVVHHIGPAAIGIEREVTVEPAQGRAHRCGSAAASTRAGTNGRDMQGIAFEVGVVVGDHIAAGVHPRLSIVQATGFHRRGTVVDSVRRVVAPTNDDIELSQVVQVTEVGDLVGEGFQQKLQRAEGAHSGVVDVDVVEVAAVVADDQFAVQPGHQGAIAVVGAGIDRAQGARGGFSASAYTAYVLLVALVDVGVIGQHVAAGVDAVAGAVVGDRQGKIVAGHRGIEGAQDGNGELGDIGGTDKVLHTVGEGFDKEVTLPQALHHSQVVVDQVAVVAVAVDDQ